MMQRFTEDGAVIPCTVIELEPNTVLQVKTGETDGYEAIQLGFDKRTAKDPRTLERRVGKPMTGHFKKANQEPCRHVKEARVPAAGEYQVGQKLGAELFADVKYLDVTGISKGKGFQGGMKRHNFKGGRGSHGTSLFHRGPGSLGNRTTPGRVFLLKKAAGRMGGEKTTVEGLELIEANTEKNFILVKGSVPGPVGSLVTVRKSLKRSK